MRYQVEALRTIRSLQTALAKGGRSAQAEQMRTIGDQVERMMMERHILMEALAVTAGNIKSLGPAGALGPGQEYEAWLELVEAAIRRCRP
jgi:hypothetical protein